MRYHFAMYALDITRHELRRAGEIVALEPKAFEVLRYLLHHHDRVVPKAELLEQCWPGTFVSEAALARSLSKIRQALRENPRDPSYIKTIHGQGYHCVAVVTMADDASSLVFPSAPPVPAASSSAAGVPSAAEPSPIAPPPLPEARLGGERRQVTFMCCELVESAGRFAVGRGTLTSGSTADGEDRTPVSTRRRSAGDLRLQACSHSRRGLSIAREEHPATVS